MDIQSMLQELDGFFRAGDYAKVEPFLLEHLNTARATQDYSTELTLLNELMGFYRGMSRFREALEIAERALTLMEALGYKGSVPYATTLLNVATAHRADGQIAKAIEQFEEVGRLFHAQQLQDPYLYASLHNNLSLAYQEAGQHDKAIAELEKALALIRQRDNSDVEIAVTYTNMALSKIQCQRLADARADLLQAKELFERQPQRNSHYGAALAALAEVAYKEGQPSEAIRFYEQALSEIHTHYGKNLYYAITLESLAVACETTDKARSDALEAEAKQIRASLA